jgi:hypothetical protein
VPLKVQGGDRQVKAIPLPCGSVGKSLTRAVEFGRERRKKQRQEKDNTVLASAHHEVIILHLAPTCKGWEKRNAGQGKAQNGVALWALSLVL